jgi:hypothetical protein
LWGLYLLIYIVNRFSAAGFGLPLSPCLLRI